MSKSSETPGFRTKSILDSDHPLTTELEKSGWEVWSDNWIGWYHLVISHPELGDTNFVVTTSAEIDRQLSVARMSESKVRGRTMDDILALIARRHGPALVVLNSTALVPDWTPESGVDAAIYFDGVTHDAPRQIPEWAGYLLSLLSSSGSVDSSASKPSAGTTQTDPAEGRLDIAGWLLSDSPIDDPADDAFDFKSYAEAITGVINDPNTTAPLVIAINAPWGAGKSSLGRLIKRMLDESYSAMGTEPHITCWFNAWMHDNARALDGALCAEIGKTINAHDNWWRRLIIERHGIWMTAFVGLLAITVALLMRAYSIPLADTDYEDYVEILAVAVGSLGSIGATASLAIRLYNSLGSKLLRFIGDQSTMSDTASMADVREQLRQGIERITPDGSRFVIFIDDIERCRPPKSVDLLEALSQLLSHENVIVVLMGDLQAVAASVDIKYEKLAGDTASASDVPRNGTKRSIFGEKYLQKIVQLQFDLPAPAPDQIKSLLDNISARHEKDALGTADVGKSEPAPTRGWQRPLASAVRATGITAVLTLLLSSAAIMTNSVDINMNPAIETGLSTLFLAVVVALALSVIAQLTLRLLIARDRAHDALLISDKRVAARKKLAEETTTSEQALYAAAAEAAESSIDTSVYEEQRRLRLTSDSRLVRDALATILEHIPVLPRNAKRLMNKLRLLILIASARGLLHGPTRLTAIHFGKWVVLNERWPEVARLVTRRPDVLGELELAAATNDGKTATEQFRQAVTRSGLNIEDVSFLEHLLITEPKLQPALERLTLFRAGAESDLTPQE